MSADVCSETAAARARIAAWQFEDAIRDQIAEEYPLDPQAREAYCTLAHAEKHYNWGILALVALSIAELPAWCESGSDLFARVDIASQCVRPGVEQKDILLSNIAYIPPGWAIIIEMCVMLVVLRKVYLELILQFDYFAPLKIEYINVRHAKVMLALVLFEVLDCVLFVVSRPGFRLAFLSRSGFLWLLPGVQSLVACFRVVTTEFVSIATFLAGTLVVFAWICSLTFQDNDDMYQGALVSTGLDTFSHALDTMFVSGTTISFVQRLLPTYTMYRSSGLLWLVFLVLVHVLLLSLVLDTLVSAYSSYSEQKERCDLQEKVYGVVKSFNTLLDGPGKDFGSPCSSPKNKGLTKDAFVSFTQELGRCPRNHTVTESMAAEIFKAVDVGGTGSLGKPEFLTACRLLQYRFFATKRYSVLQEGFPKLWSSSVFQWLKEQVDGDQKLFDLFMNFILMINFALVLVETFYDLQNWTETPLLENLELIFAIVYLCEIAVKLSVYSLPQYWAYGFNQFDFITTILLAVSSFWEVACSLAPIDNPAWYVPVISQGFISRYFNILRTLRLLRMMKQLRRLRNVQFMVNAVLKILMGSKNILTALGVVVFFFTTLSVQLWGGLLCEPNLDLEETAWHKRKWFALNFNDFLMAFGVWVVSLLREYVPEIAEAIWEASGIPGSWLIVPMFYVCAVISVFGLVKAFTIELFVYLSNKRLEEERHGPRPFQPLLHIEKAFAERDIGFHYCLLGNDGFGEAFSEGDIDVHYASWARTVSERTDRSSWSS